MANPQGTGSEGPPKHVFRSQTFSRDYFTPTATFSNLALDESPEATRLDAWTRALLELRSSLWPLKERLESIDFTYASLWEREMGILIDRAAGWKNELACLEYKVIVSEHKIMLANFGVGFELPSPPAGYVADPNAP
ncbi:MAG: hypothetical protein Q9215_006428 [Flavoplaca cf. flavocitrina]